MNNISQSDMLLQDANNEVSRFITRFKVGDILKKCNAYKQKGVSSIKIFTYLIALMFQNLSTYMAMRVGAYKEDFSKNTIRRFCNNASINWHKFMRILSNKLISEFMRPATSDKRDDFFIFDDTPFNKSGKKTELVSRFFNHVTMKHELGYRILSLLWSDGYSNVPVDFVPLSSSNNKLLISDAKEYDSRSIAGQIRKHARMKAPELMLMMISKAKAAGHKAKYVLFDSWFATPKGIIDIKENTGMDVIANVKKTGKVYYEYEGNQLDVKKIFSACKKRRGVSKYLLSVNVNIIQKESGKISKRVPAKIVYVRNKSNKKEWIAIISTDTTLSEDEIIRRYGYRWNIEVYFKTCKQYLKYTKECQSTSFDSLTTHITIANVRYMILSMFQRESTDERSLGELFCLFVEEVAEITFDQSLRIIVAAMFETVKEMLSFTEEQMAIFVQSFIGRLPEYLKKPLLECTISYKAA